VASTNSEIMPKMCHDSLAFTDVERSELGIALN
jgi:hypothetical protein